MLWDVYLAAWRRGACAIAGKPVRARNGSSTSRPDALPRDMLELASRLRASFPFRSEIVHSTQPPSVGGGYRFGSQVRHLPR